MKFYILALAVILCSCCNCEDLDKCDLYNDQCQLDFLQKIGREFAFTGIPDAGIPVIDPFNLTNVFTPVLGFLNLTLVKGDAVGIQKCLITKYITNVPERYKEPVLECGKIVIRGHYKLSSAPAVQKIFGDIHGDGFLQITLDDWYFKFRYPFSFVKRANGLIYLDALFDEAIYQTHVGKVHVEGCGLKLEYFDISNAVTTFMNDNWQMVMASDFGNFIYDASAQYYYEVYNTFYTNVPATEYLSNDLEPLVEEEKPKKKKSIIRRLKFW